MRGGEIYEDKNTSSLKKRKKIEDNNFICTTLFNEQMAHLKKSTQHY